MGLCVWQGGIGDSMKQYESRLKVKTNIDRMQIDFECCGNGNYKDWWNVGWWGVRWLNTNSGEVQPLHSKPTDLAL